MNPALPLLFVDIMQSYKTQGESTGECQSIFCFSNQMSVWHFLGSPTLEWMTYWKPWKTTSFLFFFFSFNDYDSLAGANGALQAGALQLGKREVRAWQDPSVRAMSSVAQVNVVNCSLLRVSVFLSKGSMTSLKGPEWCMKSVVPHGGWYWPESGSSVRLACLQQKWLQEPLLWPVPAHPVVLTLPALGTSAPCRWPFPGRHLWNISALISCSLNLPGCSPAERSDCRCLP